MPKKKTAKKIEVKKEKVQSKKVSESEFDKKVLELAESGLTSEKIGEALRKEGIHPKEHGKKISQILKQKEKYINPDLKNISEKLEKIKAHFEKNHQDKRAMREKDRVFSQLRILKKYHEVQ